MRGDDEQTAYMFSYLSPEQRVPADHPLRPIRRLTDAIFDRLSPRFDRLYSDIGRPSIAPEKPVARVAGPSALFGAERAAADGTAELQHVVSLVCRAQHG